MPDVFLSYAREDRTTAERLVRALEQEGLEVWYDRQIQGGEAWAVAIQGQLEKADCVVVLWSRASLESEYVNYEASQAKGRGVYLPVLIEKVVPPLSFRDIQVESLTGWTGDRDHPAFVRLLHAMEQKGAHTGEVSLFLEDVVEAIHRVPRRIIRAAFHRQGRLAARGASLMLNPPHHPVLTSFCLCTSGPALALIALRIKGAAIPLATWMSALTVCAVLGWILAYFHQRMIHHFERRLWNEARMGLAQAFPARPRAHNAPNPILAVWGRIEPLLWSSADSGGLKSLDCSGLHLLSSDTTAVELAVVVATSLVLLAGGNPRPE